MNRNSWRVSPRNANNIIMWVNGVCCTVYLQDGRYKGVRNGQHTDSYPSQRLAMSALYDLLPRQQPPPPPPPAPKPEPKKMTLAEEIFLAGDGDYEVGYRRMSLRFHPDLGGSHERQVALNAEIAKLRKANVN